MRFSHTSSWTQGYEFDYRVFEPSFPSFLLPYHPDLALRSVSLDHPEAVVSSVIFDRFHLGRCLSFD